MISHRWSSRSSLSRFLVISIAVHLALVLPFKQFPSWSTHSLGQPVLEIDLEGDLPVPMSGRSPHRSSRLAAVTADHAAARLPPAESEIATTHPRAENDSAHHAAQGVDATAGLRNQLLGEIRTRLSQYLSYPVLAREHGWEGRVLLAMRVESDGRFENIRVERGSGYAVLDHSALNSLNRLQRLAEAAIWLDGRSVDLQLPVTYRLVGN